MPMRTCSWNLHQLKTHAYLRLYLQFKLMAGRQIPIYNKAASQTPVVINQVFFPRKAVRCTVQMATFWHTDHINNLLLSMLKRNLFKSEIRHVSIGTRTWASCKLLSWPGAPTGYNCHDNSQLAEQVTIHLPMK